LLIDTTFIDDTVQAFLEAFEVPGCAVAIVGPGTDFRAGYGVRVLGASDPVDVQTRFAAGSNTKAYTAALIGILVDRGSLDWDMPVRHHVPEFRMADPVATELMTLRDLLCHRSGLPLGAGDLLLYPGSTHAAADALKALPFLKLERSFRSGYAYDNILYTVAGLVIERVTGLALEDVFAREILAPLGLADAAPSLARLETVNVAGRHGRRGGAFIGQGPVAVVQPQGERSGFCLAAGGLQLSISDQARWLMTQLAGGVAPSGERIWSQAQAEQMWTPQVVMSSSDGATVDAPDRPVLKSYALGWIVQDYRGERLISHGGGLNGQITQTALLPGRKLGVAVFSNAEGSVTTYLRNAILDHLIGVPPYDWLAACKRHAVEAEQAALSRISHGLEAPSQGGPTLPLRAYVGRYVDPWYGQMDISLHGDQLQMALVPAFGLKGPLRVWGDDTFRTEFSWDAGEDALVTFHIKDALVENVTLRAFSPLADFSYDYHHLDFKPVR